MTCRSRWIDGASRLIGVAMAAVLGAPSTPAQVQFGTPFGCDMVLQRGGRIPVWGSGAAGERVTVQLNGQSVATTTVGGTWRVELPVMPAGGPFTMSAIGIGNRVDLTNVMVGDVWLCAGQSNMIWPLQKTVNGEAAVQGLGSVCLRLRGSGGAWEVANAVTAPHFSAVGFYFGRALATQTGVPTGLILAAAPGSTIGEWQVNGASFALIRPLLGLAFRGTIWYQGESNVGLGTVSGYEDSLRSMIEDWRRVWGRGVFPFLLVQLANRREGRREWMEVRDAQLQVLDLPATAMACIVDLPPAGIHPRLKLPVGERLARAARVVAHGEPIVSMGPILDPAATWVRATDIALGFNYVGGGLTAPRGPLTGFEIAAGDLQFVPAQANIVGDQVVVSATAVARPVAVRYAWSVAINATLFNAEGLPASPFRFLAHRAAFGAGCGPTPPPRVTGVGMPRSGRRFEVRVCELPRMQPGALLIGASRTSWGPFPLPWPLGGAGMPGCSLLISGETLLGFAGISGGSWTAPMMMPAATEWLGLAFYAQAIAANPAANPAGVVVSNGAAFRIGF